MTMLSQTDFINLLNTNKQRIIKTYSERLQERFNEYIQKIKYVNSSGIYDFSIYVVLESYDDYITSRSVLDDIREQLIRLLKGRGFENTNILMVVETDSDVGSYILSTKIKMNVGVV